MRATIRDQLEKAKKRCAMLTDEVCRLRATVKALSGAGETRKVNRAIELAAEIWNTDVIWVIDKKRGSGDIVAARFAAMDTARRWAKVHEVAAVFDRKHSAVVRASAKVRDWCEVDEDFRNKLQTLRERVKNI
jgi:chromosomal replication initiation ATPase DnaA